MKKINVLQQKMLIFALDSSPEKLQISIKDRNILFVVIYIYYEEHQNSQMKALS